VADFNTAVGTASDYLGMPLDSPDQCALALCYGFQLLRTKLADPATRIRSYSYFRDVESILVERARSKVSSKGDKGSKGKEAGGKKVKPDAAAKESNNNKAGGGGNKGTNGGGKKDHPKDKRED
jgi:hypothetical protein